MSDTLEAQQATQAYQASLPTQQPQQQPPQQALPTRAAPPPTLDPSSPVIMLGDDSAAPTGKVSLLDYGKAAWSRVEGMGESALGAASLVARKIGADPEAVQHIEDNRKAVADAVDHTVTSMSPDAQHAMHASIFGGGNDENGEHIPTPGEVGWGRYVGMSVANVVPDAVLAAVSGKLLGTAGPALAFGTLQAGDAYNQLVKQVDQSKPEDWNNSPMMQEMLHQGMSFDDAKRQIVGHVAGQLGAMQFGLGAVTGAGAGQLLMRGPLGVAGKGLLARMGLGAVEGAGTLGLQSGGGDAIQQNTEQQTGLSSKFDTTRLARAVSSGALGGALLGAGGGAFHGGDHTQAPAPAPEVEQSHPLVSPEISQALNTQPELPGLNQAKPGTVGANPQGELFRSAEDANRPGPAGSGATTPPGEAPSPTPAQTAVTPTPSAQPAQPTLPGTGPRPSDGMKRQDLLDALSTMPNQDPKVLKRMSVADMRTAYDKAGNTTGVSPTTAEPANDVGAQLSAVADQANPKDAAFFAPGTKVPDSLPRGVTRVVRPEGTLVTTDAGKAATFQGAQHLDDTTMAGLLGYPESKQSAVASGSPTVVQGQDAQGNVVHESVASPAGVPAARAMAAERAPNVVTTTPEAAQARRADTPEPTPVDKAAAKAEAPTPAQAEAGNYQKGHTNIGGLDISIETPRGEARKGIGPDGTPWETTMPDHYGYIKRTLGADGDHVDVTLGPKAHEADQHQVYVVDQKDPATGKFDEHKAFLGYDNPAAALDAYDKSFSDGSGAGRRGALNPMSFDDFKEWTRAGDTKKAISYKPDSRILLAARRAAQKAKMAAPGERVQGKVVTGESEAKAPEQEPRTYGEVVNELHEALNKTEIIPLKKGADVDRVMGQVMRELSDRLAGAKTEGDIHEALAKWGRSSAEPLPGTRTRRLQIADRVMQLMTGKTVDEFSGRAARISNEVRSEPRTSVYESDKAARQADVEAAHAREQDVENETRSVSEGSPEGQQIDGKETPEPTKIIDKLPWWLDRVTQGQMTAAEADAAYGRQSGGAGRKRQFATFADYLDDRIQHAEDPDVAASLRKRLTFIDKTMKGQALSAETERVNKLLDTTGKEAAERYRQMKAELDPVGEAVAAEVKPKRSADVLRERLAARKEGKTFSRGDTMYSRVVSDPRVNKVVDDLLSEGRPRSVHDYLDAIANDRTVQGEAPALASLARRLRSMVREDVEVVPHEGEYNTLGDAGTFYQNPERGTGQIEIARGAANSKVETVLHEALHSVTSHYIDSLPENHPDLLALKAIGDELRHASEKMIGDFTPAMTEDVRYALSSPHELHTMLMTNPEVQALAASHTPSMKFRGAMRTLGQPLQAAKSVWSAFTAFVRRSVGLKGPSVEATLLDHIMRPIQDIAERAAAYNQEGGSTHPAETILGRKNFRDAVKDVTDRTPLSNAGDATRKGLLQASTFDGLVDRYRKLLPEIADVRKATEALTARGKQFHDSYADRVADWTSNLKGPERDNVASLLVDASTADVRLGKNADNNHLTTVGQQDRLTALQTRYDALSAKGKSSYDSSHKLQDAMYAEEREARLNGMLKGLMPEATKEQLDAVRDASKSKASLGAFMADPDHSDVSSKFGAEWSGVRPLVRGIAKIHDMGFVQGDYFPLRRFGDYVLHYGDRGEENYGVEMFRTVAAAEARREELTKQGAPGVSQVLSKRESHLRDMINAPAIDEITAAMHRRGESGDHIKNMQDLLASIVMQHATHSEGARARLRRQGVKGASTDVEKVVASDFLGAASRIGYLEHGVDRSQAIQRMQDRTDKLGQTGAPGEQRVAQAVTAEVQKRVPVGDDADNFVSKALRKASPFGYIQSLMSPSHMLTSTIEAHMNSTALLGSRHGLVRAGLALTKALKDVSPILATGARNVVKSVTKGLRAADWNLSTVVRDRLIAGGANGAHMTALFDSLNASGLIDHTYVRELQRTANPRTELTRGWWGKFLDLNSAGAHAVDVANKSAIAKAAFDLEYNKTGSMDAAVRYATDTARKAMPNYNLGNKARITTGQGAFGALGAPLTQFKNYGIHMYTMMSGLVQTSMHGATSADRMEARKAFAGILASHALMAGSLTLIGDPLRWIGGAYDLVTGASKPHDYENDVRRVIADAFGPELGEIISRGVPHALGIDIHRRVGLANLLEPPELQSFDKKGVAEAFVAAMTGAAGEDAATMAGGVMKLLQGDPSGIKDMVPRIVRDAMKAEGLATQGVADSKGKTVLPADKLGTGSILAQALGFQPAAVSEFREGRYAVMEARDESKAQRSKLVANWLGADPDDRSEIMTNIRHYNQANPGQTITIGQLIQAQQNQRKQAAQLRQGSFGLTLPKGASQRLSQEGSFANTP